MVLMGLVLAGGCSHLHHHQLGDIDSGVVLQGSRFELLVSQVGVNIQEAGDIAKGVARSQQARDQIQAIQGIIALFQMGPRTGNDIYSDTFADHLTDSILERCPTGRISGLSVTRETAKYPIVSGEIVKIVGYCMNEKGIGVL